MVVEPFLSVLDRDRWSVVMWIDVKISMVYLPTFGYSNLCGIHVGKYTRVVRFTG